MGGLKDQDFRLSYRSNKSHIVRDFYVPALKNSNLYLRGVAYFTSSSLKEVAEGLEVFVEKGGTIRLVMSVVISESDKKALAEGLKNKDDIISETKSQKLKQEIKKLKENDKHALDVLSWLIANDQLQIKIALSDGGIYHEKFGLFLEDDKDSYCIGFSGSSNETVGGLIQNFESIDIYQEKFPREKQRLYEKKEYFDDLWENRTRGLYIVPLPLALKKYISTFKPKQPPKLREEYTKKTPRGYQKEAIDNWIENGYRGILKMATGTGKTFTALEAIKEKVDDGALTIIIVPRKILMEQWEEEMQEVFPDGQTFFCGGDRGSNWKKHIPHYLQIANTNAKKNSSRNKPIFIITTLNTARTKTFRNNIEKSFNNKNKLLVIVDEVHRSGSPENSNIFEIEAMGGRLGLSATPIRQYDDEGNKKILNYFDDIVMDFGIDKAIKHDPPILSQYEYHIHKVHLKPRELEDYNKISKKLAKYHAILEDRSEENRYLKENIKRDLRRRKNIIKEAENKLDMLEEIVRRYRPKHCFVYCNDADHVEEAHERINDYGRVIKFTTVQLSDEQIQKSLNLFKNKDCNILIAKGLLDEGVDLPICEDGILLSSSSTEREFIQRRGRLLRVHEDKEKANIHDMIVFPCDPKSGKTINETEFRLLRNEINRAKIFAEDALNSHEAILQLYDLIEELNEMVEEENDDSPDQKYPNHERRSDNSQIKTTKHISSSDVPQKENPEEIYTILELLKKDIDTAKKIAQHKNISERHGNYFLHACRILGWYDGENITEQGKKLMQANPQERVKLIKKSIAKTDICRGLEKSLGEGWYKKPEKKEIVKYLINEVGLKRTTAKRRAQSLISWATYLNS